MVTGKDKQSISSELSFRFETDDYEKWDYDMAQTEKIVSIIKTLCDILKNHQESVLKCFKKNTVKNPLREIKAPAKDFLILFEELFGYVTLRCGI